MRHTRILALAAAFVAAAPAGAQQLDSLTIAGFRWRELGPATFEGRVSDIAAIPLPSRTFFVAAAAAGVWKTTNGGITYRPVFENERVASMGALAIAPSDTMQVWAGTGEQNSRNSIEPGGGIYKSTDGGLTWQLMGLEKTEHIGRIVVHPTNPNIVYVAALGAAWRTNPERGLYKTTDGGRTWTLSKFISDRAGFVDVIMHPRDPNTLWAASYERIRGPYFLKSGGPGSALWKTTDGGTTWNKVEGGGWPTTMLGRIGLAISLSDPNYLYAMVEADTLPNPRPTAGQAAQRNSGLYQSTDGGRTWAKTNNANVRPFYYSQVRVDTKNPNRVYFSSTPVMVSDDGGRTARTATQGVHVDHHAMWIDPNDPNYIIVGNDGGIAVSYDKGGNYQFGAHLPLAQWYEVSYDFAVPYNICGGAQDNGSWCGPSRRKTGPVGNQYWFQFHGGDGFYTAQDPTDPNILYAESQGGNMTRVNRRTGERTSLAKPQWRTAYMAWEDSILIARGDTMRPATREQQRRIADLRARQRQDSIDLDMRYNWNTPFFLSPHNPMVFYAAGNRVLKSTNRGDNLYPISPDLSKQQMAKIDTSRRVTGGITLDATGAEMYGTIVTLAESPVRPGWLYAGTDDGNVWMTRNDGATWEQIPMSRFAGIPSGDVYVTRIEASHHDPFTFYVAFDNHRWGDFNPYLYATSDGGRTFRSITSNLPRGGPDYLRVVREDPHNPDLLFVGTGVGVYASIDRGRTWNKFMTGMPTLPVYDLKIHPRDRELIAATHGRGFWIVDIAALEQMNARVLADNATLFAPTIAFDWGEGSNVGASQYGVGHQVFLAQSPPHGAEIVYRLASPSAQPVTITISDASGVVRTMNGTNRAGINRVTWDLRGRTPPSPALSPAQLRDSINRARRIEHVLDSLSKAGIDQTMITAARGFLTGQTPAFGGGGGGGGRGAAPSGWVERPGEGPIVGAGGRGAGAGAGANVAEMFASFPGGIQGLAALVGGLPGGGRGGRGGGAGAAPFVATGDYLVTVRINGQDYKQPLRVERLGPGGEVPVMAGERR